jgi:hypothetical protein
MRVVASQHAWQHANKQNGVGCDVARLRPATDLAMTTAAPAAERSFGIRFNFIHHNYIKRPWGPGGASPG